MKRWNVYERRAGSGYAFMRGCVRAANVEAAVTEAAKKWGVGNYFPLPVKKEPSLDNHGRGN